jgi:hypothetical protein
MFVQIILIYLCHFLLFVGSKPGVCTIIYMCPEYLSYMLQRVSDLILELF